ncbi:hypothetical protein SAMN03080617_04074 [Algoriphagus alkaliphilus]|uniref:Uncharacterized protein n=1 Tax=Algoriphagus alkaliphilus TaxID=279824 RepID=A0A1G5ZMC1_9BACT|nr:hypothetical protein SAMN03080617_04074 [Algoriphagus alkaliphilus]
MFWKILAIYLAPISRSGSIDLPVPHKDEQPFPDLHPERNLFDLSTHKVCLASFVTIGAVGSYPTFSPLPFNRLRDKPCVERRFVSVALSVLRLSPAEVLPVRKYGALRCPDFPLSRPNSYRVRDSGKSTCTLQFTGFSLIWVHFIFSLPLIRILKKTYVRVFGLSY